MNYTQDQKDACYMFLQWMRDPNEKYMILQGSAGTGKTAGMLHFLEAYEARRNLVHAVSNKVEELLNVKLLATTNQAAHVLRQVCNNYPVNTVHKHFKLRAIIDYDTGEKSFQPTNQTHKRRFELLIIDESSFLSPEMFEIFDMYTKDCKILLVGDYWQLAPVGHVFCGMQQINTPFKFELNEVVRHNGNIADAGAHFRKLVPTKLFTPFTAQQPDIEICSATEFQAEVNRAFTGDFDQNSARILAWTNKRVNEFNTYIRKLRNMPEHIQECEVVLTNKPIYGINNRTWANTDSHIITNKFEEGVEHGINGHYMQIEKNVWRFLPNNQADVKPVLDQFRVKKDWQTFWHIKDDWLDLRSPFASTIHKAQGSTFEEVFIDLNDIGKCNIYSEVARILYVALTRASKRIWLYGQLPDKYGGIIYG